MLENIALPVAVMGEYMVDCDFMFRAAKQPTLARHKSVYGTPLLNEGLRKLYTTVKNLSFNFVEATFYCIRL